MLADTDSVNVHKQSHNKLNERSSSHAKKHHVASKKNINIGLRIPGSNWQKFKTLVTSELPSTEQSHSNRQTIKKNRKRKAMQSKQFDENMSQQFPITEENAQNTSNKNKVHPNTGLTKVIAMDCEMVGIGEGQDSMIARVSIVNRNAVCIYDKYVKPTEKVQDYRTAVSGIRPQHLENGEEFRIVQKEVANILKGRILVGHALHNDLAVLFLTHPKRFQRDTSRYKLFRKFTNGNTPSLKALSLALLGIDIQSGEHDSIEDARATMQLYQLFRKKWEIDIKTK